jgi:hypothetical protein
MKRALWSRPRNGTASLVPGVRIDQSRRVTTQRLLDLGSGAMSDGSIKELRARAVQCREMARTASNEFTTNSLLRLAERFETLATQKEKELGG